MEKLKPCPFCGAELEYEEHIAIAAVSLQVWKCHRMIMKPGTGELTMYKKLIEKLRFCASDTVEDCAGCPYQGGYKGTYCMNGLVTEAADAIESASKAYQMMAEAYEAEVTKQVWVPVTELPEERGNYLVVINCPRGRWDEICAFDGEGEWVSIDEYAEVATKWVTHWMSLPEPPKEEEGE